MELTGSADAGSTGSDKAIVADPKAAVESLLDDDRSPAQLRPSSRRGKASPPPGQLTVLSRPTRRG